MGCEKGPQRNSPVSPKKARRDHPACKESEILKIFKVTPVPKPRMTQRDRWDPKKRVLDYFEYKDELRWQAGDFELPESGYHVIFVLPMPRSWSAKKKTAMDGKPHQQTPDKDNLEKALLDALCNNGDSYVWDGRPTKVWGYEGMIIILRIKPPSVEEIKSIITMAQKIIPAKRERNG